MIRFIVVIMMLCCMNFSIGAQEFRIINAHSGKEVTLQKMVNELSKKQLVFFGEFHGEQAIHQLQRDFLREFHSKNPRTIVSFEMFERDVQSYLDLYLGDEMTESDFLLNSRPWSNYEADYKPLIDFAKNKQLNAIAANVPRYLAGKAVRNGKNFRDGLTEREISFVAKEITAPDDQYKELFMETMGVLKGTGKASEIEIFEGMYYAQCLKDDTMAESITNRLKLHPKYKMIHFNGDFHSKYRLGTVQRVLNRVPKLKIGVITPLYLNDIKGYKWTKQDRKQGDFLLLIPQPKDDE